MQRVQLKSHYGIWNEGSETMYGLGSKSAVAVLPEGPVTVPSCNKGYSGLCNPEIPVRVPLWNYGSTTIIWHGLRDL